MTQPLQSHRPACNAEQDTAVLPAPDDRGKLKSGIQHRLETLSCRQSKNSNDLRLELPCLQKTPKKHLDWCQIAQQVVLRGEEELCV